MLRILVFILKATEKHWSPLSMEETEFYFQFAKSTHYSVKMDWRKEMSVDEDGSIVALDLGSDSDIGGKKCSDSRDI